MVKEQIDRLMQGKKREYIPRRVLFIAPHCSTGGMPQYLYQSIKSLKDSGYKVGVVEYRNIDSDHYAIQKRKIKSISEFYTLNGDRREELSKILSEFSPEIVHFQEFPETWMDEDAAKFIYAEDRNYKIIETSHGSEFNPAQKKYRPDHFAFVGKYHAEQFKDFGVPYDIVEYPIITQIRPDRTEALKKLGLDPLKKHVLNVGLFAPWKNQGEIFEIARKMPDLLFHFVGNQAVNFKSYWEPLMREKPENCIVWGEREDVEDFYGSMDLFLFTSTKETNPIVTKEALSWQMPILMRNLRVYMGEYDKSGVRFIDENIEETCSMIRKMFPSMAEKLKEVYSRTREDYGNF